MLHGFPTAADAKAYLPSELFTRDVVGGLTPLLNTAPDVRVYDAASTEESVNISLEPYPDVRKQGLAHAVPPTAAAPEEARQ